MDGRDAEGRIARILRPGGWRAVAGRVVSESGSALRASGLVADIGLPRPTKAGTVAEIRFHDDEGRSCAIRIALVLADGLMEDVDAEDGILFGVVFLDSQRSVDLSDGWKAATDRSPTALGIFTDDLARSLASTLCGSLAHYGTPLVVESSSADRVVRHELAVPLAEALLQVLPEAAIEGRVGPGGEALVLMVDDADPVVLSLLDHGVAWMRDGASARFMPADGPWGMTLSERAGWLVEEILDRTGSRIGNVRTI